MSSHTPRCYILVIRVTASLTLVLIWIICSPSRNIGRGFIFLTAKMYAYPASMLAASIIPKKLEFCYAKRSASARMSTGQFHIQILLATQHKSK